MPKTYDKKAWLEQKELTKEENLKIIQNIVNNFKEDPEKILEFIDFQSRFYNYSTRNTMLIYSQNPGASFVGSFAALKKITDELAKEHRLPNGELPYYGIKKGAKAIKIFVPQQITYLKNENSDWIQLSKADKQLQLEYKKGNIESYQRLGFGIGNVFDISQTNLPIALYPTVISEGFGEESEVHKQFAEYITDFCKQHNIEVRDMNEETVTIRGLARNDNIIELNPLLNDTGRLSTLLHEVGHELLHFSVESNIMPISQREVEIQDIIRSVNMKLVFYSILVPNTVYWITYFVICEVLKMDSLVGAIIGSAATIFAGILGLIGVCISNGRKSKKLNDNLVKLQDCQIGVKDGELSIANRLGVTNGEGTNLTTQHKTLMEDHTDIKKILNEEIKKSINSVADNAKDTYNFIMNESNMKKQREQLLENNDNRWSQAIDDLTSFKNILEEKNQLIANLYQEKYELIEENKELNKVVEAQAQQIEELNAKLYPDTQSYSQEQRMYPTL